MAREGSGRCTHGRVQRPVGRAAALVRLSCRALDSVRTWDVRTVRRHEVSVEIACDALPREAVHPGVSNDSDVLHHAAGTFVEDVLGGRIAQVLDAVPLCFDDRLEARTRGHGAKHTQIPETWLRAHELCPDAPRA